MLPLTPDQTDLINDILVANSGRDNRFQTGYNADGVSRQAVSRRLAGETYTAIGKALGLCAEHAHYLVNLRIFGILPTPTATRFAVGTDAARATMPASLVGIMSRHNLSLRFDNLSPGRPQWSLTSGWGERITEATNLDDLARAAWEAGYTLA